MKASLSILGVLLVLILNLYFNVSVNSDQAAVNIEIPKITKLRTLPEALILEGKHDVRRVLVLSLIHISEPTRPY